MQRCQRRRWCLSRLNSRLASFPGEWPRVPGLVYLITDHTSCDARQSIRSRHRNGPAITQKWPRGESDRRATSPPTKLENESTVFRGSLPPLIKRNPICMGRLTNPSADSQPNPRTHEKTWQAWLSSLDARRPKRCRCVAILCWLPSLEKKKATGSGDLSFVEDEAFSTAKPRTRH